MSGLEGRTLDRYKLKQLIGKGGMADVYLGYDPRFERTVAIKVFRRDDEDLLRRFIREARLMANLRHASLMPIYDTGESVLDGLTQYYIVMPFMENGTLRGRIRRQPPLSLQEISHYLTHIADALDYIHKRGIIHRDIKSSNVLLDTEGRCYLSDFGIARTATDATMTTTGGVLGTVDYVAPELFEEGQKANAYSDLYSLGILLFEMVTRRFPFVAESQIALIAMHINNPPPSPRRLAPQISAPTERVILKALAKRPELRYATATTFAEAFCLSLTPRSGESTTSEVTPRREPVGTDLDDAKTAVKPVALSALPVRPAPLAGFTESHLLPATNAPFAQQPAGVVQRSLRFRRMTMVALALVMLLVVMAPALFFALSRYQLRPITPTPEAPQPVMQMHTTATSTTRTTVTPIPNVTTTVRVATATAVQRVKSARATALAQPTAIVQPPSDTTTGVQTAPTGNALYTDPLNNSRSPATAQSNWTESNSCTFQGDGYHASSGSALVTCMESSHSYGDATIAVDMTLLSGQIGGVAFRMSSVPFVGNYAGYLFEVDSQGNYSFSCSSITSGNTVLKEGSIPRGFRSGYHVKNTLQIVMNGSSLSFYVNGIFLDQETNTAFGAGTMGFLALSASATYSRLRVYSIA
jgi:eukaryotic-like serine/threonine-protein kinase